MNRAMRILVVLIGLSLLTWGLWRERHPVWSFGQDEPKPTSGLKFVEGTTYDGFVLKDGRLYDAYSLSPGTAQQKDCKT